MGVFVRWRFCFVLFSVLGVELRTSGLIGRHSTTLATLPAGQRFLMTEKLLAPEARKPSSLRLDNWNQKTVAKKEQLGHSTAQQGH
jgi:hypothetical protein